MKKRVVCKFYHRAFSLGLSLVLLFSPGSGYAQSAFVSSLPEPGVLVSASASFVPLLFRGLRVHPDKPLSLDFIADSGDNSTDTIEIKKQSERIAKYFMALITVPEDQLWVNLSPFEKDRIIPDELGRTVLGRDMLAQDYMLKQLTASLIYPESRLGRQFWTKIYKEAQEKFGTTDIPVDTFNKVWITPQKAEIFEKNFVVYVTDAKLGVMLDSDYGATAKNQMPDNSAGRTGNALSQRMLREIILPAIEKEVNEGVNFAPIRQIYYAAILAKWYRQIVQQTLLGEAYIGKNRVAGVTSDEQTIKEEIYQRYIAAYKQGVFNYVKDTDKDFAGEMIPRKYFSGGENLRIERLDRAATPEKASRAVGQLFRVGVLSRLTSDSAERKADPQVKAGRIRLRKLAAQHPQDAPYLRILAAMLPDIHPRKRTHVVNVVENFYRIIFQDYEPLYEALDIQVKQATLFEEYAGLLREFTAIYHSFPEREKWMFPVLVIFHDIGSMEHFRDWRHNQTGADLLPAVLRRGRHSPPDEQAIAFLQKMIYFHGAVPNLGVDFLPYDFFKLSPVEKNFLFLFSFLDMSGRQNGRNAASIQNARELKERYDLINASELMNDQEFVDYRIGRALSPFFVSKTIQQQRVVRLDEYLARKQSTWNDQFHNNWARTRVNCFDIFDRLSIYSYDAYLSLLAQISDEITQLETGLPFRDIVIDSDIDYMGLPLDARGFDARNNYVSIINQRIEQGGAVLFSSEIREGSLHLIFQLRKMGSSRLAVGSVNYSRAAGNAYFYPTQMTIAREAGFEGVGLHNGQRVTMRVLPAPANAGIVFVTNGHRIRAVIDAVVETEKTTLLTDALGNRVFTPEHILSALGSVGINNALIDLGSGNEVPMFDGSAEAYRSKLTEAGQVAALGSERKIFQVQRPVIFNRVGEGVKVLVLPTRRHTLRLTYLIEFEHPLIGSQYKTFDVSTGAYWQQIAGSRTFIERKDLEGLIARGRYQGIGNGAGAVVLNDSDSPGGDTFSNADEAVAHKILDLFGDLQLAGFSISAHVIAIEAGHRDHNEMVRKVVDIQRTQGYEQYSLQQRQEVVTAFKDLADQRKIPKELLAEVLEYFQPEESSDAVQDGGIDIHNITIDRANSDRALKFNDAAMRRILKEDFGGLTPVIIDVLPIKDSLLLLDMNF